MHTLDTLRFLRETQISLRVPLFRRSTRRTARLRLSSGCLAVAERLPHCANDRNKLHNRCSVVDKIVVVGKIYFALAPLDGLFSFFVHFDFYFGFTIFRRLTAHMRLSSFFEIRTRELRSKVIALEDRVEGLHTFDSLPFVCAPHTVFPLNTRQNL